MHIVWTLDTLDTQMLNEWMNESLHCIIMVRITIYYLYFYSMEWIQSFSIHSTLHTALY